MTVVYFYNGTEYATEAEAQAVVPTLKTQIENNPTDWMEAKELIGSNESGWTITDDQLTDAEILSPDSTKMYSCYSQYDGENYIGLTHTELTSKVDYLRRKYGDYCNAAKIVKIDTTTNPETITEIETTVDMSNYTN
jgi:hypothetical protein